MRAPIQLHPIFPDPAQNGAFLHEKDCRDYLDVWVGFYQEVGFHRPWAGYFAEMEGQYVGTCAFKGPPKEGKVEIAYATFERFQGKGVGTAMCAALVEVAQAAEEQVRITARTLTEENASTKILRKNGFQLLGTVLDPEDGEVWEWEYKEK